MKYVLRFLQTLHDIRNEHKPFCIEYKTVSRTLVHPEEVYLCGAFSTITTGFTCEDLFVFEVFQYDGDGIEANAIFVYLPIGL